VVCVNANQTVGGIVLPEVNNANFSEFIVEAIGEKVTRVAIGNSVIFPKQAVIAIDLPNVEKGRALVKEEHILGILIPESVK
jgi:co-chaperonin GroES (HSP10)